MKKVGVIGAGTMGQGIAKAFAQSGWTVALCDIKQEWADGGKAKIQKGYAKLVEKGKMDQAKADATVAAITAGLKEDAVRRLRPDRGGRLRGYEGQAGHLRRAGQDLQGGLHLRLQHLLPVHHRDR